MARGEDVGLIEKHVEKIVLAVAAIILVVAGFHWGLDSPRRIELGINAPEIRMPQKNYPPGEVDQALKTASGKLEDMLEGMKPDKKRLPDYAGRLERIFENPYDDRYVHIDVDFGTGRVPPERRKATGRIIEPAKLADLLPLPKTEKPLVAINREVQVIPRADREAPEYKDVCVAHVAAVFERGKVLKKWQEALKKTYIPAQVVFVAVEAQRRCRLPDGSWSQPEPASMMVMPGAPTLPVIPAPDEKNLFEIQQKVNELAWLSNQKEVLEPSYYDIIWPNRQTGPWYIRNHKPRTRVSDLMEQEEEKPAGAEKRTAGGERAVPRRPAGGERAMPRRRPSGGEGGMLRRPAGGERAMPRRPAGGEGGARRPAGGERAMTRRPAGGEGGMPRRRPSGGERARAMPRRPAGGEGGRTGPGTVRRPVEIDAPMLVLIPTFQEQLDNPAGILEVWFHDTGLTEGMVYSYRLRLVLVNPLLGRFKDVADKADAVVQTLKTPWSDWSESVEVKRPTEFFLVGSASHNKTVVVEVFTQRWGQRVSERFPVGRGEPIGGNVTKELLRLGTGEPVKTVVSFKTGAIAVSFNFQKRHRVPGTDFFRTTTTEMLYLDAGEKLRTRTQFADESSQRYKDLLKEVRQASGAMAGVR